MGTVERRLDQHWRVVKDIRRDHDLARRKDVLRRHLLQCYSNSEKFLENFFSILMEAVLAEEPDKTKKLAEVKKKAVASLEEFIAGLPTVVQDGHEEGLDNHQDQRAAVNERPLAQRSTTVQQDITIQPERTGQQNLEEPIYHSSLNVGSEFSQPTAEYHQCRKRKAQYLDHVVSDLLLNAALGETLINDSPDSAGEAKLRHVLDLMRVGRFRRAIEDIIGCWSLDDCQVIVQYGVAIFQQQKIDKHSGYMSFAKHFGYLMREGIHERFIDLEMIFD